MSEIRATFATILLLAAALATTACASTGRPRFEALEEAARQFRPVEGRSVVYFVRDDTASPTYRRGILVDGELAGSLAPESFLVCVLDPGSHELRTREGEATLTLETEAGALYFVRHRYGRLAFDEGTSFETIAAPQGRSLVEDLRGVPASCGFDPGPQVTTEPE